MKYISLDLETTSLVPDPEHILMISMIVEDSEKNCPVEDLPHFTCFVKQGTIHGQAYALAMNSWILDIISGFKANLSGYPIFDYGWSLDNEESCWIHHAMRFLDDHFGSEKITVAGKNVAGFDIPFLSKQVRDRFRHRVLDPGSLYVDWSFDKAVPDFGTCKRRAGILTPVAHDAREDAMDVIRIFRAWAKTQPSKDNE